ncbi:hypothetical protein T265_13984 [Opisthorchis viverrini]|uniref:3-hydroxybutyryl-CoA dehydrogenase n=1 Tax=Opisthorchis viverrini TaxID=6198 RepID=A0A074ZGZ3_OPIVI|nr:hypothetical protein T265_13984 [Opisthorchis viverrini]KER26473.1 hypothetical protein T265_13984 [Opisthorchis viverrini]
MIQSVARTVLPRVGNFTNSFRGLKYVSVVGGGLMGTGIAQVCVQNGYAVNLIDLDQSVLSKSVDAIRQNAHRFAKKKYPNDESSAASFVDSCLANLGTYTCIKEAVHGADLVIEAIVEKLPAKQSLFLELEKHASPECLLVSNTSSLSLRQISSVLSDQERFGGLHFFQPAPVLRLVEVVRTTHTSEVTFQLLVEFVRSLDKVPIACQDTPGYIVNRLLLPYLLDSIRMVERGFANPHDVDVGMKLGASHPMGPFELCDFIGLDTLKYICESLTDQMSDDPTFMCPNMLHHLVAEGRLGKKTRHGFFKYDAQGKMIVEEHR